MLEIYSDCMPVGWREMAPGGFAKGVLQGLTSRISLCDGRVGQIVEHNGERYVVVDVVRVGGVDYFAISNGDDYDHIPTGDDSLDNSVSVYLSDFSHRQDIEEEKLRALSDEVID